MSKNHIGQYCIHKLSASGFVAALWESIGRLSGQPRPRSPEVEEELLRIAQEATNNASQHAQAREIRIALEYSGSSLTLSLFPIPTAVGQGTRIEIRVSALFRDLEEQACQRRQFEFW